MIRNSVTYDANPRVGKISVFYTGSDEVAEGDAVCYDLDRGTAANVDFDRMGYVEVPSSTNNLAFAGVAATTFPAKTGGQVIEIFVPGSTCLVNVLQTTTTLGYDRRVTFVAKSNTAANVGLFRTDGMSGRGSGRILQTLAAAGLCLVKLEDGMESGGVEELLPITGATAPFMVGGTTVLQTVTIAADCTVNTLANATTQGLRKKFLLDGTITTSDYIVTVTNGKANNGVAMDTWATTGLDASTEGLYTEFHNGFWMLMGGTGTHS